MFIAHRINSIKELLNIHSDYGIEVDLRDNTNGEVYISHDPFTKGELFKDYLIYFQHKFIILNIKSEGIEYKVIEYLKKFNIKNYFFLDSSFPMIIKLNTLGEKNIALRFSEFESIETIITMKNKVKWVWIDCFTSNPLNYERYIQIKNMGYKICFVSPELQNQVEKISEYKNYFKDNNIKLDAICTKKYNIYKWNEKEVQIIIPMSGLGQRFVDKNYKNPKPLIEVDGKPIIQHVVELFPGENNIHFICNDKHLKETNMKQLLEEICPYGKIHKVPVEGRMGPVHAVQLIESEIDNSKEVIISYCDYGTYWNYKNFLKDTRDRNAEGSIACYKGFHPHMLGNDNYAFLKETNEGSRWMEAIQEKKSFTNNKMNEYASNGTYYFKNGMIMKKYFKKLMELEMKVKNEYYVSMVYNLLIEDNLKVNIFEIENMLQWGTPYDLEIYKNWSNYFNNLTMKQDKFIDNFDTTLVLPLAGNGSRFSNKGYLNPKPLLDVDGLPMIVSAVKCLPESTNKTFICLQEHLNKYLLEENIKKYYPESKVFGINKVTEGQACTTEIGIEKGEIDLDKPILVSACDNGVYYNVNKYQSLVNDIKNDIIVWSFRNEPTSKNNPNMYAWMTTDQNDFVINVSCKKFIEGVHDTENSHVIIGTIFFRKAKWFIEGLKQNYNENIRTNNEFYVDDVLNQNIKNGLNVKVFEVDNYICWGTPDDYETYLYWQNYFDKCWLHPYRKILHTEKNRLY